MITKNFNLIGVEDIKTLIDNQVLEGKTLEYKSILLEDADKEKIEFLADVSSFANTEGGDLIFGIFEDKEKKELKSDFGINIEDSDVTIQRLENIIRDGISPRVSVDIRNIVVADNKSVLIIRVKPSLDSPHRVIFKNSNRFFKRNSNGKYEMDVFELKNAFGSSSSIVENIINFRKNRIFDIKSNNGPIMLENNENFVTLHIIPLVGMLEKYKLTSKQLADLKEDRSSFNPLYARAWNSKINLRGVCVYSENNKKGTSSYTQAFREGIIEGFDSLVIGHVQNNPNSKIVSMVAIENIFIKFVKNNLELLKKLEIKPPFFIFITFVGVKGLLIETKGSGIESELINENDIFLPEVILDDYDDDVAKALKPVFDMVWNAAGHSSSGGYNEQGERI